MSQIKIVGNLEITDVDGDTQKIPLFASNPDVTKIYKNQFALGADTTAVVWDPFSWSGIKPDGFNWAVMLADGDLDVEYVSGDTVTAVASDTSATFNSFRLKEDVPYILGSDRAYADDTTDTTSAFGTTLSFIKRIRVDEPNSAAVNLRLWIIE